MKDFKLLGHGLKRIILISFFMVFVAGEILGQESEDELTDESQVRPASRIQSASDDSSNNRRYVSIDFNNVDISVFIKFMSELTGKNFIIDRRVKGNVTIISPAKISVSEAYKVFESVLEVNGFATVPSGKVVKIIPAPDARTQNIKTVEHKPGTQKSFSDRMVTQLVHLKYADSSEVKRLFTPLISKSSVILDYPTTNMLIITDYEANINRLMHILNTIDVTGVGHKITMIPVKYSDANKMVKTLSQLFQSAIRSRKGRGAEPDLTMVADERTNAIVMKASNEITQKAKALIAMLDKETVRGKGNIHVVRLENATAEELAKVLKDIPQKEAGNARGGKNAAPAVSDNVRITADKPTNSLIITADKEDFEVLNSIIKQIDIPRSMVYIEAAIVEVNADSQFNLGSEWFGGDTKNIDGKDVLAVGGFTGSGISNVTNPTTGQVNLPGGMSLGVLGEIISVGGMKFPSLGAFVQALKTDTNTDILSTPQILTTDNEEASITVAENVPFQTKAVSEGSSTVANIEYKDVGKILKITPHVSKDRMIRLAITLEVNEVKEGSVTNDRPTTLTRKVETTVIVKDKNTLVLGGLIDDTTRKGTNKVPCLGDIPIFGWGFKHQKNSNRKTNLYVFIKPQVIQGPSEAKDIYSKKKNEIQDIKGGQINLFKGNDAGPSKQIETPTPPDETSSSNTGSSTSSVVKTERPSPSAETAPAFTIPTEDLTNTRIYSLKVDSYSTEQKANERIAELNELGYPAYSTQEDENGSTQYEVRAGFYTNKEEAVEAQKQLEKQKIATELIQL